MAKRELNYLADLYGRHKKNREKRELDDWKERFDIKAAAQDAVNSGLSFREIADALDVSPTTISRWVSGK